MVNSTLSLICKLSTNGFHGYNLQFSPLTKDLLAVACSENFGVKGCGAIILYDLSNCQSSKASRTLKFQECLYDITWNLRDSQIVLSCSAEGNVQIWNINSSQYPVGVLKAHDREISSLDWCPFANQLYLTSSWDTLIKIWDAKANSKLPVATLRHHSALIYEGSWSKVRPDSIASASGDGTLAIWEPSKSSNPILTIRGKPGTEILTCSWSNCSDSIIATASTDSSIEIWDLRFHTHPLHQLIGHNYPVRRLSFSPFLANELVSVSYDFTTKLWDFSNGNVGCASTENHSEFTYGVAYDPIKPGRVVDCSWDGSVNIYQIGPRSIKQHSLVFPESSSFRPNSIPHTLVSHPSTLINSTPKENYIHSSRPLPPLPQGMLGSKL